MGSTSQLLESIMLICFGFSWPMNAIKAYRARTAKGTSLAFILLIITGYIAGIAAKIVNHQYNYVLAVYFLNLAIVMVSVAVYIRNVALDKKRPVIVEEVEDIDYSKTNNSTFNVARYENANFRRLNEIVQKNQVVLFGGTLDSYIPVTELAQSFHFNFKIYNRSQQNISLKNAKDYFEQNISNMQPEGLMIHLGENDLALFQSSPVEFDRHYMELISAVKSVNKKCRLALVSIKNPDNNNVISEMNRHIQALSQSENAAFINLDDVKVWNPKATQASVDFAYSMGLNTRKPLRNVAEILYSFAYLELPAEILNQNLVG